MKRYLMLLALVAGSQALFRPAVAPVEENGGTDIFADDDVEEYGIQITTTLSSDIADSGPKKCGMRQASPYFKASADINLPSAQQARFAEFNWAVPIFEVLWNGKENYTCTGSLIHPQVVLTVAHYFTEKKNWLVRAGDWNVAQTGEFDDHQSIYVSEVVTHPLFKKSDHRYDAALLFLTSPVTTGSNIGFTCLPPAQSETPSGAACIVTGWGQEKFNDSRTVDVLKMVDVPAVSKEDCEESLRNKVGQAFHLHKSFMCAGGRAGQDSCLRDGGGPLVCPYVNSPNQYYQAGLVSWGHDCGLAGVPGVYTNVAEVRQWIDDKMAEKSFTTETYTP